MRQLKTTDSRLDFYHLYQDAHLFSLSLRVSLTLHFDSAKDCKKVCPKAAESRKMSSSLSLVPLILLSAAIIIYFTCSVSCGKDKEDDVIIIGGEGGGGHGGGGGGGMPLILISKSYFIKP